MTLEKDGLLRQPNDIILPDNRVTTPVAIGQYTLYEFHSCATFLHAGSFCLRISQAISDEKIRFLSVVVYVMSSFRLPFSS